MHQGALLETASDLHGHDLLVVIEREFVLCPRRRDHHGVARLLVQQCLERQVFVAVEPPERRAEPTLTIGRFETQGHAAVLERRHP